MPPIHHQETPRGGISGNRLLVRPGAAPAILLWMQGESRRGSLPWDGPSETRIVRRAASLFAFILCGGLVLAWMLPPLTDAGMPQIAIKMQNIEELEAEERWTLRLLATRAGAFDRGRDLRQGFIDMPIITVLQEPMIDTGLSSLPLAAKHEEAPKPEPILPEPQFAQEFWRAMGHSRFADAYAAYLGRYSWKIREERHVTDLDLGALGRVDAEEMKRLDARRRAERLHISLFDVPLPRRAPRAASVRTKGTAKTARAGCRNRIWRCTPPIANMAQGNAQRFRSRHN
jgi:hypothetical protein